MMTNESTNTEHLVMRRVHAIHALRPLISSTVLALLIGALALWGIGREVWVARVLQNAPHTDIIAAFKFFLLAFADTRLTVQALCVAAFVALLWFFRDLFRIVSVSLTPHRA